MSLISSGAIGLCSTPCAPACTAQAPAAGSDASASTTHSFVDFNSRTVFSRKPASAPSSQSTTIASNFSRVTFSTEVRISEQNSTSMSNSARSFPRIRAVSASEVNKRRWRAIDRFRLPPAIARNKLRRWMNKLSIWNRLLVTTVTGTRPDLPEMSSGWAPGPCTQASSTRLRPCSFAR